MDTNTSFQLEHHKVDIRLFHYTHDIPDYLSQRMTIEQVIDYTRQSVLYNFLLPIVTNKIESEKDVKEEKLGYVTLYDSWFAHLLYTTWIGKIKWLRNLKHTGFTTVPRFHNTYITNNHYNVCPHIVVGPTKKHIEFLTQKPVKTNSNDVSQVSVPNKV